MKKLTLEELKSKKEKVNVVAQVEAIKGGGGMDVFLPFRPRLSRGSIE